MQEIIPQISTNQESIKSKSNSNTYYYKFNKLIKINSAVTSN